MRRAIWVVLAACSSGTPTPSSPAPAPAAQVADAFPLARLDERALCDRLLARRPDDYRAIVDRDPELRRAVIVSDLHLGPGTTDPRFTGIEDFYSDAEWGAFLDQQTAPTDLIIDGDFIEFWQIAAALHVLPARDASVQPTGDVTLAEDQDFGVAAAELVIGAHPTVFRDL